ncbi:MAG: TetR/AcrR family transcriptional regulator, partial [Candidatus Lindowbacteria bacterium]|nr:TetR/AcrR family transcriptional regulator [Candidatus Lindowbacteria bacterium]
MANATLLKLKKSEQDKRRGIILFAAEELFSKRGISGVKMRDVARKAGVSVGFIYRYFPKRTDIFVELLEAGAGEICGRLDAEIKADGPRPFHRLARTYISFLHENKMFFQMMSHFMLEGRLSGKALERVNAVLRRIMDKLEVMLENNGRRGDSRILAHSFFAAMNGVMISLVNYPGRSPDEIKRRTLLLAEAV